MSKLLHRVDGINFTFLGSNIRNEKKSVYNKKNNFQPYIFDSDLLDALNALFKHLFFNFSREERERKG